MLECVHNLCEVHDLPFLFIIANCGKIFKNQGEVLKQVAQEVAQSAESWMQLIKLKKCRDIIKLFKSYYFNRFLKLS